MKCSISFVDAELIGFSIGGCSNFDGERDFFKLGKSVLFGGQQEWRLRRFELRMSLIAYEILAIWLKCSGDS